MAKKIFGSNLRLTGGKVVWGGEELASPYLFLGSEAKSQTFRFTHLRSQIKNGDNSPKKHWAALHAANQIFTENPKSFLLVDHSIDRWNLFFEEIRKWNEFIHKI